MLAHLITQSTPRQKMHQDSMDRWQAGCLRYGLLMFKIRSAGVSPALVNYFWGVY
ncbi:MAG: hypothetical protein AAGG51_11335 [Cyanobacteria bacterium P01_G01_bin.54]